PLYAFDAAGNTNCSGTPKTCAPLWTSSTGDTGASSPVVANGIVYVTRYGSVHALDATGNTNCSGSPKSCAPLWTATITEPIDIQSPAVANGILYVGSGVAVIGSPGYRLYAFDAAGNVNCSGTPKTCTPLWTGWTGS